MKNLILIIMLVCFATQASSDNLVNVPKPSISTNLSNSTNVINHSKLDKEFKSFSNEEYKTMLQIMSYGIKDDLGYTLAAIAWKESMFGRWNLNLSDGKKGSFGPFHILLEYSLKRNSVTTNWGESRLAEKHLYDLEFTTNEAISILKDFKSRENCNLRCAIASYNAGNNGHTKQAGQNYANEIFARISYLKKIIKLPDDPLDKFEVIQ